MATKKQSKAKQSKAKQSKAKQSKAKQPQEKRPTDYLDLFRPYIADLKPGSPGEYMGTCPLAGHLDKTPSFSVKYRDGVWQCFGCEAKGNAQAFKRLIRAGKLKKANPATKTGNSEPLDGEDSIEGVPPPTGTRKEVYDYLDEWGNLIFQAVRFEPKGFSQRHRDENGEWVWNLKGVERIPYRLYDLAEEEPDVLYIAEGEKDVNRLWDLDIPATCNPGGAGKWKDEYTDYLTRRLPLLEVRILADADEPGWKHALQVAKSWLDRGQGQTVRIVKDWPGGAKDVSDYLDAGYTMEDLIDRAESTEPFTRQDLEKIKDREKLAELHAKAGATQTIYPAQDVTDGVLRYGILPREDDGNLCFLTSEGRVACVSTILPAHFKVDDQGYDTFRFSKEGSDTFMAGETVNGYDLLNDLAAFFRRYVIFPDERLPELFAVWTLGTYLYRAFSHFPYIILKSPVRRCGKNRVLTLLGLVAFNAPREPTISPTIAHLFREPSRNGGTYLLDEVDNLQGDKETFKALLQVLNAGFQKGGGTTPRYIKDPKTGKYFPESHDLYCPHVLAGIGAGMNKALSAALEDRSIIITMQRRLEELEHIEELNDDDLDKGVARQLRDRCYIWALTHMPELAAIYKTENPRRDFPALYKPGIDDRARDIFKPLLSIARLVDKDRNITDPDKSYEAILTPLIHDLCKGRDEDDDETVGKLISTLLHIFETGNPEKKMMSFTITEWFAFLKELEPDSHWVESPKWVQNRFKELGFKPRVGKNKARKSVRLYDVSLDKLHDLARRYSIEIENDGDGKADKPGKAVGSATERLKLQ